MVPRLMLRVKTVFSRSNFGVGEKALLFSDIQNVKVQTKKGLMKINHLYISIPVASLRKGATKKCFSLLKVLLGSVQGNCTALFPSPGVNGECIQDLRHTPLKVKKEMLIYGIVLLRVLTQIQ